MACPGSFPSCHEENDLDPKSGWDLDLDKPVCAMACSENVTNLHFCMFFVVFVPNSLTFATNTGCKVSSSGTPTLISMSNNFFLYLPKKGCFTFIIHHSV